MSAETTENLTFQISNLEKALDLPQTGIQRNRTEQILVRLRDRLEQERKAESRRLAVNPEGLARRAALCKRLGLPLDTPARKVFQVLLSIAERGFAGRPSFVEDHFSEQDYIDAMEEFVTDPSVSDTDREEAEKLLADLKESFRPVVVSAPTKPTQPGQQNQPSGPWRPSDGVPGKAAEPQPTKAFAPFQVTIGGPVNVVFSNPGRKA